MHMHKLNKPRQFACLAYKFARKPDLEARYPMKVGPVLVVTIVRATDDAEQVSFCLTWTEYFLQIIQNDTCLISKLGHAWRAIHDSALSPVETNMESL